MTSKQLLRDIYDLLYSTDSDMEEHDDHILIRIDGRLFKVKVERM